MSESDPETDRSAQDESWDALLERIAALAHRRSKSLLTHHDEDDDAFDRGARSLRTLMSAAEVAQRMKRDAAKETEADDEAAEGQLITEAAIEAAYRKVSARVEQLEREESAAVASGPGSEAALAQGGSDARSGEGDRGAMLEGERS